MCVPFMIPTAIPSGESLLSPHSRHGLDRPHLTWSARNSRSTIIRLSVAPKKMIVGDSLSRRRQVIEVRRRRHDRRMDLGDLLFRAAALDPGDVAQLLVAWRHNRIDSEKATEIDLASGLRRRVSRPWRREGPVFRKVVPTGWRISRTAMRSGRPVAGMDRWPVLQEQPGVEVSECWHDLPVTKPGTVRPP